LRVDSNQLVLAKDKPLQGGHAEHGCTHENDAHRPPFYHEGMAATTKIMGKKEFKNWCKIGAKRY
jgi:hypothetical protein